MKKHPKFRKSLAAAAKPQNRAFYVDALMGALSGVILTVLGVAVYALILLKGQRGADGAYAVNQVIKIVSIVACTLIACRGGEQRLLRGVMACAAYGILTTILMACLGHWPGFVAVLLDVAMAVAIGAFLSALLAWLKKEPAKGLRARNG